MNSTHERQIKAFDAALSYIGYRARTERQVRDYLARKRYPPAAVEAAVEKLKDYGYVDDAAFAKRYVETRAQNGPALLRQKLRLTGADEEAVQAALSSIPHQAQLDNVKALLEKKLQGARDRDSLRRAMQSAARRGFSYDVVREAANLIQEEEAWEST